MNKHIKLIPAYGLLIGGNIALFGVIIFQKIDLLGIWIGFGAGFGLVFGSMIQLTYKSKK